MEWIKDHILGLPLAAAFVAAVSLLWLHIRMRMFGSRRSSANWQKHMELFGDPELFLGGKRINPDTLTTEGDAASLYYKVERGYVYEMVGNVRHCWLRSYVIDLFAFYQWETERKLGKNIMTHFAPARLPSAGIEEREKDGKKYWVVVPVADVYMPEMTTMLETPAQKV